jgi:pimeloyl-ACP methyl ester carboxylesterase
MQDLTDFARVFIYDKRGTGLSDPISAAPSLDERMDDIHAVLDAAGSECATLFGISEGGPISALFAATHPARTEGLIVYGSPACGPYDPEAPAAERWAPMLEHIKGTTRRCRRARRRAPWKPLQRNRNRVGRREAGRGSKQQGPAASCTRTRS